MRLCSKRKRNPFQQSSIRPPILPPHGPAARCPQSSSDRARHPGALPVPLEPSTPHGRHSAIPLTRERGLRARPSWDSRPQHLRRGLPRAPVRAATDRGEGSRPWWPAPACCRPRSEYWAIRRFCVRSPSDRLDGRIRARPSERAGSCCHHRGQRFAMGPRPGRCWSSSENSGPGGR